MLPLERSAGRAKKLLERSAHVLLCIGRRQRPARCFVCICSLRCSQLLPGLAGCWAGVLCILQGAYSTFRWASPSEHLLSTVYVQVQG